VKRYQISQNKVSGMTGPGYQPAFAQRFVLRMVPKNISRPTWVVVPAKRRLPPLYMLPKLPNRILKIILCLLLGPAALAQELPLHKVDSLAHSTDILKLPDSGWLQVMEGNLKMGALDSLQQEREQIEEQLRSKGHVTLPAGLGDLNTIALTKHLDSLRAIKSPDTVVTRYMVSMKAKSDSLQSLLKLPPQTEEIARQQQRVRDELNRLPSQVNEKLRLFSDQGVNIKQLPGFNFPDFIGPGISAPGPGYLPSIDSSLPQVGTPSSPVLPDFKTEISRIGDVASPLEEVSAAGRQVAGAHEDFKTIASGNLDSLDAKSLENKLAAIDELADAGGEIAQANRQAELVKKWNSDPMYQRELAVTMAKEQAVNHFSGRESELLAAMEQLSKAKASVKDVEQVVDLFAKPVNPMKGKPFIERLRPGVNLQLQWNQIVLLDINPYIGCRLSGRWTAGLGWNERIGFNSDTYTFSGNDRIYGPRAFVHFKLKESNFLILSPEMMHTSAASPTGLSGESANRWVPGLMAGYRREFRYSKKVIGTVQFLYNLVTPAGQSGTLNMAKDPYASRFNLLFGFEFPLKKKNTIP